MIITITRSHGMIGSAPAPLMEGAPYNLLVPLRGGRTCLEGTSYYRNEIWPAQYWREWPDAIIHTIHPRALEPIQRQLEPR